MKPFDEMALLLKSIKMIENQVKKAQDENCLYKLPELQKRLDNLINCLSALCWNTFKNR